MLTRARWRTRKRNTPQLLGARIQTPCVQDSTRSTLEQLKSIRTTAVALTTRVRKFKTELEDILTDDQDMCVPCLLAKPAAPTA